MRPPWNHGLKIAPATLYWEERNFLAGVQFYTRSDPI